jgi:hypothetical protein
MKKILNRLIRNFIMRKFPEVKDFSFAIYKEPQGGKLPIVIVYYLDLRDFGGDAYEFYDRCGEIKDSTESVYKMIGDDKHGILNIMCKDVSDR